MPEYPPPPPETCPYCGSQVEYHPTSRIVYGEDYGPMWVCSAYPYCKSFVASHEGQEYDDGRNKALGTLADPETRRWRHVAHEALDPLWKRTELSRSRAYAMIANILDCEPEEAHIALLDAKDCKNLIWALMKHGPQLS